VPQARNSFRVLSDFTLVYALSAYIVARAETTIEEEVNKETIEARKAVSKSKPALLIIFIAAPFSFVVYFLPLFIGVFTISLLWSDMAGVLDLFLKEWAK
jgi:hypothetical protein